MGPTDVTGMRLPWYGNGTDILLVREGMSMRCRNGVSLETMLRQLGRVGSHDNRSMVAERVNEYTYKWGQGSKNYKM